MARWANELNITATNLETQPVTVGVSKGSIVGFCAMSAHANHYEVEHLWVLSDHTGRGVGKQLLQRSISQMAQENRPTQTHSPFTKNRAVGLLVVKTATRQDVACRCWSSENHEPKLSNYVYH